MTKAIVLSASLALALFAAGCEDPDNFLDGSLTSVYDLGFDSVEASQFLQSKSFHVEYVRSQGTGEEKPLMVTLSPTPTGPGTFVHGEGYTISMQNAVSSGTDLPPMSSGRVVLEAFTPGEVGSEVRGTLHAMFTNVGGGGDAFSLEGAFKTTLLVVP